MIRKDQWSTTVEFSSLLIGLKSALIICDPLIFNFTRERKAIDCVICVFLVGASFPVISCVV